MLTQKYWWKETEYSSVSKVIILADNKLRNHGGVGTIFLVATNHGITLVQHLVKFIGDATAKS